MTKEEKAKEYVEQNMFNIKKGQDNTIIEQTIGECNQDAYKAYISGYDSRSTEVDQLRKALREAINLFYEHEEGYVYLNIHDWISKSKSLLKTSEIDRINKNQND